MRLDNDIREKLSVERYRVTALKENDFLAQDVRVLDDDGADVELDPDNPIADADDVALDYSPDTFDHYLGARLLLPNSKGERVYARVTKRAKGPDGQPLGKLHGSPMLDSRVHEVEFNDGETANCYANVIAENLFAQVDSEG